MARLPSFVPNKKLRDKKVKLGGTSEHLLALKQMGDEPSHSPLVEIDDNSYARALLWYNTVCSRDESRAYAEKYLQMLGRSADAKRLKQVPDAWFPVHIGWIGRMATRGIKLKRRTLDAFETRLNEAFAKVPTEKSDDRAQLSTRDKSADKASDLMSEIEKMTDKRGYDPSFSAYDWLTKKQVPAGLVSHMVKHFGPIAEEIFQLHRARTVGPKGVDPQIVEGYSRWTKSEVKSAHQFYTKLMGDFERYVGNIKKQRAPRKKKEVSPEKKLRDFKYQKESKEFKLTSLNPEKVFSSDELWTFNTKYKVLTVLRATEGSNLDVSGTSFKGYDEARSKSYRLGRKPERYLDAVSRDSKRNIARLVSDLKEAPLAQRSGENTVLVRAF